MSTETASRIENEISKDRAERQECGTCYGPDGIRFSKRFDGGEIITRVSTYIHLPSGREIITSYAFRSQEQALAFFYDLERGIA